MLRRLAKCVGQAVGQTFAQASRAKVGLPQRTPPRVCRKPSRRVLTTVRLAKHGMRASTGLAGVAALGHRKRHHRRLAHRATTSPRRPPGFPHTTTISQPTNTISQPTTPSNTNSTSPSTHHPPNPQHITSSIHHPTPIPHTTRSPHRLAVADIRPPRHRSSMSR